MISRIFCHQSKCSATRPSPCFDTMSHIVACVCSPLFHHLYIIFHIVAWVWSFISRHLSRLKLLFIFWHLILCCPSLYCIPHAIIKCQMTILLYYFPCLAARFFHVKTARYVRWHHSLPTFGFEIALSARMSAPSFAGSHICRIIFNCQVYDG